MRQKNVELQNETILLRPWQHEDARWYVEARDEEIYRWTTESRTLTIEETEKAIEQVNASERVASFAIVDTERNQLVGNIALVVAEDNPRTGEVMYWLAPECRGRGITTQALALVCQWAFTELGIEQVTLQTHVENLRSQRVAERVGFKRKTASSESGEQLERIWFVLTKR